MKATRFSIITVCKNPGESFQLTMESIQRQVYQQYEYIVIDGASTDGTVEVIKNSALVSRSLSARDNGIYDAMNKGITLATGEYVYFLNCGDSFNDDNVLLRVNEYISQNGGDVVYGDTCMVNLTEGKRTIKQHKIVDKYYLFNRPVNHQALFAKRDLFDKVGMFDTSFTMKADHHWTLRCFNAGAKFLYCPIIIVNYVLHGFAYQNRSKFRTPEKKRIQKSQFKSVGRFLVRIANRLNLKPTKFLRSLLNKFL